jgi:(p)ppGpp synthase/HD superfamily hydrolase
MHDQAEYGAAAHWFMKHKKGQWVCKKNIAVAEKTRNIRSKTITGVAKSISRIKRIY